MKPTKQVNNKNNIALQISRSEISSFTGPIPPAEDLKKYEQILPGAAERLFKYAEQETAHRQTIENKRNDADIKANEAITDNYNLQIKSEIKQQLVGLICGVGISITAIIASVYSVIISAHPTVSIALVSIPVSTMVKTIIDSWRKNK